MAVNTKMPLTNTADGYLCEGTDIRGGYFTIDLVANIPATIAKKGALCYVTGTETTPVNKFYQYNGTNWVEKEFGTTTEATTSAAGLMSAADKTKLAGIASGAEVNVQADWNETNTSSDAYIKNKPALKTVATSGSYNDLTNKPTIPTVNNATLTIQKNGTTVATFTANSSTNQTANIVVPTGAAADKGVDTSISAASTSANLPTSAAVAAFVEGKGYKTYTAATSSKDGLMSKTDKANLDTIVNSFNSDDSNTTIDTVKEVLKAFENAPEGTNITNALANKSNVGHNHEATTAAVLTGVKASGTDTFVKTINGGSGSLTSNTTTDGIKYVESVTHTAATLSGTTTFNTDAIKNVTLSASESELDGPKYVESVTHTAATLGGTTSFVTGVTTGSGSLTANDTNTGIAVLTEVIKGGYTPAGTISLTNGTAPSMGSATTKYLSASASGTAVGANGTGSVAPSGHTHTVTVSGITGTNSGTAVKAVTGYGSFSGGSLTGTKTFNTDAIKSVGGTKNYGFSSSTSDVMYSPTVTDGVLSWSTTSASTQDTHTGIAASTGTVGFTAASLGTASTSDVAPAAHTHSYGSSTALTTSGNSGTAVTALTGVKITAQPTIALAANTSTAPGRIKYVEAQGTFSAGTTPKTSASFSGTKTNVLVTDATTKYLHHTHTSASSAGTGTVTISGGSITPVTKYMKKTTTAASTDTVGISGGSITPSTKYLHHTHTAASAATTGFAVTSVASNGTVNAVTAIADAEN